MPTELRSPERSIRLAPGGEVDVYDEGRLPIEHDNYYVACDGHHLRLTRKEFSLFTTRARSAGRVATRQRLLDDVWGHEYYGDMRTLDVHIRRLRQKLGACGDCIETVIGVGYRFAGCSTRSRNQDAAVSTP